MIVRKVTKVLRKLQWSSPQIGSVPLRWHVGQPNFGDDLNPYFFQKLLAKPVRLVRQSQVHLLGIGSILNVAKSGSIVAGCGLLSPELKPRPSAARIISLRGYLTAEAIGCEPGHYGDPALLVARLFPRIRKALYRIGVIPHHSRRGCSQSAPRRDVLFIDPGWHPLRVIDAITQCQGILSQSLHGLIIADAYDIPNGWLAPDQAMIGGEFKFADYFGTTKIPKQAFPTDSLEKLLDSKDLPLYVSPFRFDLGDYQSYLVREIKRELA